MVLSSSLELRKMSPQSNSARVYDDKLTSFMENIGADRFSQEDRMLLEKAFIFGRQKHDGQVRESGEEYYTHPVAVAETAAKLGLDSNAIIAALLHDVIEDTNCSMQEVIEIFGDEIAHLIDGVTKLTRIEYKSRLMKQVENFQKLIIASSKDIRVVLIKLCDRLHNMQTIGHKKSAMRRKKIALETVEIYAPLAERMGIYYLRDQLQDLSLQIIQPEIYATIKNKIDTLYDSLENNPQSGKKIVSEIIDQVGNLLKSNSVNSQIYGRRKTVYSVWRKLQQKNLSLDEIGDILAFRIVVGNIEECYKTLGIIHRAYHNVPMTVKDYISTPKNNDYKSIHTIVIGPGGVKIEIQIRTLEMHRHAEFGIAAHWMYKRDYTPTFEGMEGVAAGQTGEGDLTDGTRIEWIGKLVQLINNGSGGAREFLETYKLEMYKDQVFVFTPNGSLINLPKDSTVLDFSFEIHSDLGLQCVGAKVNGRVCDVHHRLTNGDQVEVMTSQSGEMTVLPEYESFVKTAKAKYEIKKFFNQRNRENQRVKGYKILKSYFNKKGVIFNEQTENEIIAHYNYDNFGQVCIDIYHEKLLPEQVFNLIHPDMSSAVQTSGQAAAIFTDSKSVSSVPVANRPIHLAATHEAISDIDEHIFASFAKCCNPVAGDQIIGINEVGTGLIIHNKSCSTLKYRALNKNYITLMWNPDLSSMEKKLDEKGSNLLFAANLVIKAKKEPHTLTKILAKLEKIQKDSLQDYASDPMMLQELKLVEINGYEIYVSMNVYVSDNVELNELIAAIRLVEEVINVKRSGLDE